MKTFKILLIALVLVLLSGCSQKVQIRALAPATVGEMASKKKVAISGFKNDRVGLSGKIESKIASHKLDRKKYFTVVSRRNIDKILKEQKLQSSDLMDEKTTTRVGRIIGAQAIINGEITSSSAKNGIYTQRRKRCIKYNKEKKECSKYEYYTVKCKTTDALLAANINIVGVERGSVIYGESFRKSYKADSCQSFRRILNANEALESLSSNIAHNFVMQLTPKYIYFNVTLLEKIEFDASSHQKKMLTSALKYIEVNRMDKAKKLLNALLDEFDGRSYVVAYDLGVVLEASGQYNEAKNMYALADDIAMEPIEEINIAINRIQDLISKRDEAIRQIDAK